MFETHAHGLDILGGRTTLGPRGRNTLLGADVEAALAKAEILGVSIKTWDNADSYATGDVVYHDTRYFRARRDVSAPWLSTIFEGDVPGKSDAWHEITEAQAYEHAPSIFGMVDMNVVQRNLNDLTPVTVEIARILLGTGQNTIGKAISGAKQSWYKSDLPGDTARKNVQAHLQWHATNLASIKGVDEQTTAYKAGDDLKKYVEEAFVEANAVEEGAQWLSDAWDSMWSEIQAKLAAIPRAVGQAAASVVKTAAGAAAGGIAAGLGIPTWALYAGGAAVVAGTGYVIYKLLNTRAAGGIAGAVTHRYLGGV
jgi:hypothetical protein